MRKTVIYCDKCGVKIGGTPIQIIPEYSDREDGSYEPYSGDEEELPPWISRMLSKEFCERCAKEVFDFALNVICADEKEPDREENGPGSNGVDYRGALNRIRSGKKMKLHVYRDGIRINGVSIWSYELFPYIGSMVIAEIANDLLTVMDREKVLFTKKLLY